jgi:hypothetical protein
MFLVKFYDTYMLINKNKNFFKCYVFCPLSTFKNIEDFTTRLHGMEQYNEISYSDIFNSLLFYCGGKGNFSCLNKEVCSTKPCG